MPEPVTRPAFFEGQILAAGDLTVGQEYGRGQRARHERNLHTYGITTGLGLATEDKTTVDGDPYKVVRVSAGSAVDVSGREIVVPEDQTLDEGLFLLRNGARAEAGAWYPVLLSGRDEEPPREPALPGSCAANGSTRVVEGFDIDFGSLGSELDLDDQTMPPVGGGPGGEVGGVPSKILLGFVQWDKDLKKFKDASARPESRGPRYAGVRADEVVARGGVLTLRARAAPPAGAPAVAIDEADGGTLTFGPQGAGGKVAPVFTVTASGDVTATGKIQSGLEPGVLVESGIATDGMLVPLPAPITAAQVEAAQALVHVHVTPRWDGLEQFMIPLECRVDADRRVHCRALDLSSFTSKPGRCDYTVLALMVSGGGGG